MSIFTRTRKATPAPVTMAQIISFATTDQFGTYHVNLDLRSRMDALHVRDNSLTLDAMLPENGDFQINIGGAVARIAHVTPALLMGGYDVYFPEVDTYTSASHLQEALEIALGLIA